MKRISFNDALNAINDYFYGDKDKALYWYMKKNPEFKGFSPYEMVKNGHGKKLLNYIASTQSENTFNQGA